MAANSDDSRVRGRPTGLGWQVEEPLVPLSVSDAAVRVYPLLVLVLSTWLEHPIPPEPVGIGTYGVFWYIRCVWLVFWL